MDLDADMEVRPAPAFAHASEAELARILDFYAVAWEYEPHTFPILFDRSGTVRESFSPDFYLPELDLYLELTTLKQRLVRKKNRKLRRLRELYPGIRIKLLYARDFRALLFKYGKLALADALTGADGQTTPPRVRAGRPVAVMLPDEIVAGGAPLSGEAPPAAGGPPPAGPSPAARRPDPAAGEATVAAPLAERSRRRVRRTRAQARARAVAPRVAGDGTGDTEVTA
jgi:hypothetical protein